MTTKHIFLVVGCDLLDPPDNGEVTLTGLGQGDTASYECNTGFKLVGVPTRTCNGVSWSGDPPVCTRT